MTMVTMNTPTGGASNTLGYFLYFSCLLHSASATPQEKKLDKAEPLVHKETSVNQSTTPAVPATPTQPAPVPKTPLSPANPAAPQANVSHPSPAPLVNAFVFCSV